jgi:hypothetical protein
MGAVNVVLSSLNEALDKLAGPNIGHMSDGLIGDAFLPEMTQKSSRWLIFY